MTDPSATTDWTNRGASVSPEWPTVPGYEILEELGRGGMGVVYKARQVGWKRLVALKMIRDGALAGPQDRGRFRIEAEAAARMRHPNIVEIYEIGENAGLPYFAMELIEGGSLAQRIAGQPHPVAEVAALIRALAVAVQHAHERKIIHRDLKPANILMSVVSCQLSVASRDAARRPPTTDNWQLTTIPKITDFGLAKRLDNESTAFTQEGAVLGTARYMAPEQADGRVHELGPEVDVYALGAILYELLTGRPPFLAETWNETIQQVLRDEPARPTRLRPDVPRDLESICLKCLEKQASKRFASAAELADDLARFLEGKPVAAVPLGDVERLARLAERDGFQIIGEIGRGSRSTVYHCLYGPLKQPVALKVFETGICTREDWEARLSRAAETWSLLAHPQIIRVHRAGWWDGAPYVAVDYMPQGSLAAANLVPHPRSKKNKNKASRIKDMLLVVEQLAELVSYLHRQGVVHGNLKPNNVLLAADGIPRLVDFHVTGALFIATASNDNDAPGGVGYLAPEVIRDPNAEPNFNTDIYGLGMILYELLTGQAPFAGATAREVKEQVSVQEPVTPASLNPEVTPGLASLCLRCLRKNPWKRYHRVHDLHSHLRHIRTSL